MIVRFLQFWRCQRLLQLLIAGCTGATCLNTFAVELPPQRGIVQADDVNIRAGNSLNHEILTQAQRADLVTIRETESEWYRIDVPTTASCYIHSAFVTIPSNRPEQGMVTANRVNLRARPTTSSSILGQVHEGDIVTIRKRQDAEWLAIAPPPSASGWIHRQFVTINQETPVTAVAASSPPSSGDAGSASEPEAVTTLTSPHEAAAATTEVESEPPPPTAIWFGTIQDLGRLVARPAHHKLVQDRRVIAFLVSEQYDLNRFLHRPVRVWGDIVTPPDRRVPLIRVDRIEAAPPPQ